MKTIPAHIQAQLDQDVNTLVWCAKIVRGDGVELGFTEHDTVLNIGGLDYMPTAGVNLTAFASSSTLAVDNAEVTAFFDSDLITEADLLGGAYDDAALTVFMVDWSDPNNGLVVISDGTLGEVATTDLAFKCEFRSLAQRLQQTIGRRVGIECDVDQVGDFRCGVDMTPFTHDTTVTVLNNQRHFFIDLPGTDVGYLTGGTLTFTNVDERNTQKVFMIQSWDSATQAVYLTTGGVDEIQVGDTLTVTAGCDKRTTTCQTKYNNYVNFQGFPHVPGRDSVLERPSAK